MSSWMKGKIALGCSIDILQKALLRIRKEWADHIETDPDGIGGIVRIDRRQQSTGCRSVSRGWLGAGVNVDEGSSELALEIRSIQKSLPYSS